MTLHRRTMSVGLIVALTLTGCASGDGVDTEALCRDAERGVDRLVDAMRRAPDSLEEGARSATDIVDNMRDALAPFPIASDVFGELARHYDPERAETLEQAEEAVSDMSDAMHSAMADARELAERVDRGEVSPAQMNQELAEIMDRGDMEAPGDDLGDQMSDIIDDVETRCDDVDFDRFGDVLMGTELYG